MFLAILERRTQGYVKCRTRISHHLGVFVLLRSKRKLLVQSQFLTVGFVLLLLAITDDDESDAEIEYEVLSGGYDEPWEFVGVSCSDHPSSSEDAGSSEQVTVKNSGDLKHEKIDDDKARVDISATEASCNASASLSNDRSSETGITVEKDLVNHDENRTSEVEVRGNNIDSDEDSNFYGHEDMERLTCENGSKRDNSRLMTDFQRREMAAKVAMKMASIFGYSSDEDVH